MSENQDSSQIGPNKPIARPPTWIDFPISSDEPVKVALFSQFLSSQDLVFEHSRRFVSMPTAEVETMITALATWAFPPMNDDDLRSNDSLNATLREIGNTVMEIVFSETDLAPTLQAVGIDLTA